MAQFPIPIAAAVVPLRRALRSDNGYIGFRSLLPLASSPAALGSTLHPWLSASHQGGTRTFPSQLQTPLSCLSVTAAWIACSPSSLRGLSRSSRGSCDLEGLLWLLDRGEQHLMGLKVRMSHLLSSATMKQHLNDACILYTHYRHVAFYCTSASSIYLPHLQCQNSKTRRKQQGFLDNILVLMYDSGLYSRSYLPLVMAPATICLTSSEVSVLYPSGGPL